MSKIYFSLTQTSPLKLYCYFILQMKASFGARLFFDVAGCLMFGDLKLNFGM